MSIHQWNPPSSQTSKMMGIGIPINQSSRARPMVASLRLLLPHQLPPIEPVLPKELRGRAGLSSAIKLF